MPSVSVPSVTALAMSGAKKGEIACHPDVTVAEASRSAMSRVSRAQPETRSASQARASVMACTRRVGGLGADLPHLGVLGSIQEVLPSARRRLPGHSVDFDPMAL